MSNESATPQDLERWIEIYKERERLQSRFELLFREYAELVGLDNGKGYVLDDVQDPSEETLHFVWEERWSFGGYEQHHAYMPYLFIRDREAWQKWHDERKALQEAAKAAKDKERREAEQARERAELKRLLSVYGQPVDNPTPQSPWGTKGS